MSYFPEESFAPIVSGNDSLGDYDYIGVMIHWTRALLKSITDFFGNISSSLHTMVSNLIEDIKGIMGVMSN